MPARVAELVDAQDLWPLTYLRKALSTRERNPLCEFAQIRGNLTDNADGNPEPRFVEGVLKLKYSKNEIDTIVSNSRSQREYLLNLD